MTRIVQGDCITEMRKMIADGIKVDAIICDIPYGIHDVSFDCPLKLDDMWSCINGLIKP
ncbi:MAG: hypothetical protein J6Y37_18770 [Paludibacteraceae bacterium]|nr:hypothetical protein [Paludibacteraceae bacterium]